MEIFKSGRRTFVTVFKTEANKAEAVKIANKHFKVKLENLEVENGFVEGDDLTIFYPFQKKKSNVWVVSKRREKA